MGAALRECVCVYVGMIVMYMSVYTCMYACVYLCACICDLSNQEPRPGAEDVCVCVFVQSRDFVQVSICHLHLFACVYAHTRIFYILSIYALFSEFTVFEMYCFTYLYTGAGVFSIGFILFRCDFPTL